MKLMEKVVADACRTDNPYEFTVKDSGGGETMAVKLLMPLGGAESGLYRSPL
jgi:hypothetical protein